MPYKQLTYGYVPLRLDNELFEAENSSLFSRMIDDITLTLSLCTPELNMHVHSKQFNIHELNQ